MAKLGTSAIEAKTYLHIPCGPGALSCGTPDLGTFCKLAPVDKCWQRPSFPFCISPGAPTSPLVCSPSTRQHFEIVAFNSKLKLPELGPALYVMSAESSGACVVPDGCPEVDRYAVIDDRFPDVASADCKHVGKLSNILIVPAFEQMTRAEFSVAAVILGIVLIAQVVVIRIDCSWESTCTCTLKSWDV